MVRCRNLLPSADFWKRCVHYAAHVSQWSPSIVVNVGHRTLFDSFTEQLDAT